MPKQKAKRKRPAQKERPYVSKMELHDALVEKLSMKELASLERQVEGVVKEALDQAVEETVKETYKRHWAITMRVLIDRFGWGQEEIGKLWNACMDYLKDYTDGRLNTRDMLNTLEHQDDITISWDEHDEVEVHNADKQSE